ncbi:MAG TPA: Ni/Fe-hydrogenase, b-type cytochrome subunit [Azospirillaceae bacterium]|nr:Ni/Fe-hydrogenase, b-type cytochrome subunit [Azospirillaceae bacterium]
MTGQPDLPDTQMESLRGAYVYETPVRLWHWINALSVVVLSITGYLIGVPLPTTTGDASEWYVMGWMRFFHYVSAYVFTIGLIVRVWWAAVGNRYARQMFYLPIWRRSWVSELLYQLRWMLFAERRSMLYLGHNPLANAMMFTLFLIPSVIVTITGFAMYAEASGHESWQYAAFAWFIDLWVNTQDLHTIHRLAMWVIVLFAIAHIYTAVREDIMSGQSMISTMVNGERLFKGRGVIKR